MAYISTHDTTSGAPSRIRRSSIFARILNRLLAADAGYKQKHALERLTREQLQDIGLTREDVSRFEERSPWDAPQVMLR